LIKLLQVCESVEIKEGCCRKIIKLFADKKGESAGKSAAVGGTAGGPTAGGPGNKASDEQTKIEFINLVEPLIQTMKDANYNLISLAASALVNLCNFSDDIKDIFI